MVTEKDAFSVLPAKRPNIFLKSTTSEWLGFIYSIGGGFSPANLPSGSRVYIVKGWLALDVYFKSSVIGSTSDISEQPLFVMLRNISKGKFVFCGITIDGITRGTKRKYAATKFKTIDAQAITFLTMGIVFFEEVFTFFASAGAGVFPSFIRCFVVVVERGVGGVSFFAPLSLPPLS